MSVTRRRAIPLWRKPPGTTFTSEKRGPRVFSEHMHAAVYGKVRPGCESRLIGGEPRDDRGDFLRLPKAPDGDTLQDAVEHVGAKPREHIRLNITRRNRIDRHVAVRNLAGERHREAVNSRLRGCAVRLSNLPFLPVHRC